LSKLPEKCPVCEKEMEIGILRADGTSPLIRWFKASEVINWMGGERLKWGLFSADFNGVRCKDCKIILFSYGEERQKE
jgi:hypothetical protein